MIIALPSWLSWSMQNSSVSTGCENMYPIWTWETLYP